jgi:hypothetical protein
LSRINRLRQLAIHTIEAFSRRPGVAIDRIIYQRARNQTQFLYLLAGRQFDFLVQLQGERIAHQLIWFRTAARSVPWCALFVLDRQSRKSTTRATLL